VFVELLGPTGLDRGLAGANVAFTENTSHFILDLETRQVYRLHEKCPVGLNARGGCNIASSMSLVTWLDDDTLRVETAPYYDAGVPTDEAVLQVDLSGDARRTLETPGQFTRAKEDTYSIDGSWTVHDQPDDLEIAVEQEGYGFALNSVMTWTWSPTENRLAVIGNFCADRGNAANYDLFVLDPGAGRLRNLTQDLQESVTDIEWNPDGKTIAAGVVGFGTMRRGLVLIDAGEPGRIEWLVDIQRYGGITPLAWNPAGDKLLFVVHGGGGYCEGVPLMAPTALEPR
jgi:Tol biopolymer transport system component